jgi:Ca2+-binding RTX toxin-like protein
MKGFARKLPFVMGVAVFISMLGIPVQVRADYGYDGTNANDEIYFGYCSSCVSGGAGLLVCRKTSGVAYRTEVSMDAGPLQVRGAGGNDYIQAVHDEERAGCQFGDFGLLTYSEVEIFGGTGNDTLVGTQGAQRLYGEAGNDYLSGWPGDDRLFGGQGNDFLLGDQGDDDLYGGDNDDTLVGGTGDDLITGGPGTDTFRCRHAVSPTRYDGGDHATDCGDTRPRNSIERTQQRDPYEEWAFMTYGKNGIIHHQLTTSNPQLLLTDRAAGASILLGSGGDMPMAGDFDRDGRSDDLAVFRPTTRIWYFDHNHNGRRDTGGATSDSVIGPWAISGDRPLAGDFDRDGQIDDVAVFRPSEQTWYFDYNHNGSRDMGEAGSDEIIGPWGNPGDIPIAGDFDRDGRVDDIAVFRPSNRTWYFDYNHNGRRDRGGAASDEIIGPWGNPGDIPIAGDFDRDGRVDDIAVFRPSNRTWYFDYNHNGRRDRGGAASDEIIGPWGNPGDIPVAGDFDRDGRADDIAVFRLDDQMWYFDYNHNGSRDPATPPGSGTLASDGVIGPWGLAGEPRATTHKQYGATCGPASLNIVMEHMGVADHSRSSTGQRDLDGTGTATVDLGYHLSMEHIMYECYRGYRQVSERGWNVAKPGFMYANGVLDTAPAGNGDWYDIRYNIGNVTYSSSTDAASGRVESWIENGQACGTSGAGGTDRGLPWVANQHPRGGVADAYPVNISVGVGASFSSLQHLKAVIKGYIDHSIPIVLGVENGGHFNTLVGYWERSDGFWIYTADPLDGWGRPFYGKPMRWRKIKLDVEALPGGTGVLSSMILYGHGTSCRDRGWAYQLDRAYGSPTLCGHVH